MSFLDYCARANITPDAHLSLSQNESDLVPQPLSDMVVKGQSKIHGQGVFPITLFFPGDTIGVLLDRQFRRTAIIGRYINHADEPNTALRCDPERGFLLIARTLIDWRDEITMDYYDTILLRKIVQEYHL